jgi:hypothetical protein
MMQVKAKYPLSIPEELEENPERLNPDWAAKMLGRPVVRALQQTSWLNMFRKKVILIDTPDYSKTDRRLMAKDLDEATGYGTLYLSQLRLRTKRNRP